jgi:hypothetical protein
MIQRAPFLFSKDAFRLPCSVGEAVRFFFFFFFFVVALQGQ